MLRVVNQYIQNFQTLKEVGGCIVAGLAGLSGLKKRAGMVKSIKFTKNPVYLIVGKMIYMMTAFGVYKKFTIYLAMSYGHRL